MTECHFGISLWRVIFLRGYLVSSFPTFFLLIFIPSVGLILVPPKVVGLARFSRPP